MTIAPEATEAPLKDVGDLDRAALDRLGIRYTVHENFRIDEIDDGASRAAWNQARLGDPVDEEHVEQLLSDLERGAEFPPIIVYKDDKGRYVTLSGNHRRKMFESAGRSIVRAYEATGLDGLRKEDERVLRLIYEANHGHGKQVALDDRIQQAISLIENGYTVRAAAAAVGVTENRVRDHYELARATRRLEELGVDTTAIRVSNQRRLMNIKSDRVLKEAAPIVPLMEKQTEEVNELVKTINAERSEDAQLTIVRDYEEALKAQNRTEPKTRGRQPSGLTADVRKFNTAVGQIARFDPETLRSGIPADFRSGLLQRVREAVEKLEAAEKVL
jgi:hypothetical protein